MKCDSRMTKLAVLVLGAAVGCWLRGWHDAKRQMIGGHRCLECGKALRDLSEANTMPNDMMTATRTYDRLGGLTRYDGWPK